MIQPDEVDPIRVLINGIVIVVAVACAWVLVGLVAHVLWRLIALGWSFS